MMLLVLCQSLLQGLKDDCKTSSYSSTIAKITLLTHLNVKPLQDIKQVKSVHYQVIGKQRLSHDALHNLYELPIMIIST